LRITNQKRVYKRKRNTSFLLKEILFQARFWLVAHLFFAKIIINNVRFFIIGAIYTWPLILWITIHHYIRASVGQPNRSQGSNLCRLMKGQLKSLNQSICVVIRGLHYWIVSMTLLNKLAICRGRRTIAGLMTDFFLVSLNFVLEFFHKHFLLNLYDQIYKGSSI
jgi:hypothetical protein